MPDLIGIVSGSGLDLSGILDRIIADISFSSVPGLRNDCLEGHARQFLRGFCGAREVVLQAGRLHFYEGLSYEDVTRPIDIMRGWGVGTVVLTNVGGGLKPETLPGELVGVDRILTWPYLRWPHRPESLTPAFRIPGCDRRGVYCWVHGPSYETPSEIEFLRRIGADVVGMSTAPEVLRCEEVRIPCAVVSCITNVCRASAPLSHDRVVSAAAVHSTRVVSLLREWIVQGCPAE